MALRFLLSTFKKNKRACLVTGLALSALCAVWGGFYAVVPRPLFSKPCATLLYSAERHLLGAHIASDGQWRFPAPDSVPDKFAQCLLTYEDKNFYYHPGVDLLALARAARLNLRHGKVTSGGSTLTMQLARMARGNRRRTWFQKSVEMGWAMFLETIYSKKELLRLYAANAPFGGNVVGVESAAQRYFGRDAKDLSWAESAMLAVLPNAPALIRPGKNQNHLKAKRDGLLLRLKEKGIIDRNAYELACMEPLPNAPAPLPNDAPHLTERMAMEYPGQRITLSVRQSWQCRAQAIVDRYAREYAANFVRNAAAIVADTETGEIYAYVGNVSFDNGESHRVDIVTAQRSTGSVLKPFLYAAMLHDGQLLPNALVPDVPLNIDGFVPQNFNKTFYGAVPARQAVEKSLNVPMVRMLMSYNIGRFMSLLKTWGMTTLRFSEAHYGASLILGGAEGSLWDLVGMYASMERTLSHYRTYEDKYDPNDVRPLTLFPVKKIKPLSQQLTEKSALGAGALWFALDAMSAVNRPEEEAEWQQFSSTKKIAWKTGTSFGGRDAWALGVTPRYTMGVWVGNASGEGRPGLTGIGYAAPLLFDLFSWLPDSGQWSDPPYDDLQPLPVCRESGYKASVHCSHVDTLQMPMLGIRTPPCPYHRLVHLSADERFRVNSSCESVSRMVTRPWFVLPPAQAYYYRNYHVDYLPLPPLKPGCRPPQNPQIELIYPEEHNAVLFLPQGFDGRRESFIFKAAHALSDAAIYWHLDDVYLGVTVQDHRMSCAPGRGVHLLTLVDEWGNRRVIRFEVKTPSLPVANASVSLSKN